MLVQAKETKNELSDNAMLGIGNQYRVKDAPVVAVFLADLEMADRIDRVEKLERDSQTRDPNYLNVMPIASSFLSGEGHAATLIKQLATSVISDIQPMPSIEPVQAWSYKNSSLMAQTFCLAATSHGLATCIMEGFDGRRTKEILRVPDRYDIPLMIAVGHDYHGEHELPKTPRLGLDELCFGDSFGEKLELLECENDEEEEKTIAKAP